MSLITDITNSGVKDELHITEQLLVSGTSTFNSIQTSTITSTARATLDEIVVRNITVTGTTSGTDGKVFQGVQGEPGEKGEKGDTVVNAVILEDPVFTGLTTIGSAIKITQDDPGHMIYKTYASGSVYGMGQYNGGILRLFTSDNNGANVSIRFSKFTGNSNTYGGNSTTFDDMMIIKNNGNVGINKANPTEKLDVNGNINCLALKINNTSILHNTSFTGIVTTGNVLQLGENGNDSVSKTLKFGGLFGDNNYEHAVIEHRIYEGTESSELLLFKGNDQNDRIRMKGGEIRFDTWSDDVNNRTSVNTKLMITTSGVMKHTAGNNSYIEYGPNIDFSGKLIVGSSKDSKLVNNATDAQVIVTSGNLHIDAGQAKGLYINQYNTQSYVNMTGTVTMNGTCNVAGTLSCQGLNVNNVSIQTIINNATSRDNPTFTGTLTSQNINCTSFNLNNVSLQNIINNSFAPTPFINMNISFTSSGFSRDENMPPMYKINKEKDVSFRGRVQRVPSRDMPGLVIFQLPVGYRPRFRVFCVVSCSNNNGSFGTATIRINTDGIVNLEQMTQSLNYISFDGIRYEAI